MSDEITDSPDEWLAKAKAATEDSIASLVEAFIAMPFAHRREHSLHVDLYQSLLSNRCLAGHSPIGRTGYATRLVHKEWPTTVPASLARRDRKSEALRLQSYDLAVLSPADLAGVPTTAAFRKGLPPARIAIELGLDYDLDHLARDIEKFRLNIEELKHGLYPPAGYVVHFTRVGSGKADKIKDDIRAAAKFGQVGVAFAALELKRNTTPKWHIWRLGSSEFADH